MDERYNVYFAGQVMDGFEVGSVRAKVAKVFNADQATLDKLFSGKAQLIKRDCDAATATKYRQALERAGAIPIIKLIESTVESTVASPAASPVDTSSLALAPPGTAVLREDERAKPVVREVDTAGLAVDATATRLSDAAPPPPAAPDTAHLSMGEVGESIPNLRSSAVPLSPNLDGLALSASGTDFSDCAAPAVSAPPLDLSHIIALPPGDIPLEEQSRGPIPVATPSIDHLSLQE